MRNEMNIRLIYKTSPSRENTCLKCGMAMALIIREVAELRTCQCGYWSSTVSGDTKCNYAAAVGSFTIKRSR